MKKKILVVEDELEIQEGLKSFLEQADYEVDVASDGLEGVYKALDQSFDLVLLDIMLPKMDGYTVLKMLREESKVPVIMLTALGETENQLKAFDLHADDYIPKPFVMSLVLKRIEAILRRNASTPLKPSSNLLTHEEITLDVNSCEVFVANKKVSLTHKEYELIHLFLQNPHRVFTRDELLDQLWGYDFFGNEHIVNVHIMNLRKKIGSDYIRTMRGKGYKLVGKN